MDDADCGDDDVRLTLPTAESIRDGGHDSDASDSGSSSESEEELDENGDPIRRRRRKEPVDKAALKAARGSK